MKSELVWEDTTFTNTPRYFKIFGTNPTDDNTLNVERNNMKLKHVIMVKKIWSSLKSEFQIEILGNNNEYKIGEEYDGPMLWDYIRRRIKSSTRVGTSKLKVDIEKKEVRDFGNDVSKYNMWFEDAKRSIIGDEGEGYNEYLRQLFRTYLNCENKEFKKAVEEEHRKWIQNKLPTDYSFEDLIELRRVTYNNLIENEDWKADKLSQESKGSGKDEPQFLALTTQILSRLASPGGKNTGKRENSGTDNRTYQDWRFENPDDLKSKEVRGTTMKWCTNDCHDKPMWCGRKNCINKTDFASMMKSKKEDKEGSGNKNDGATQLDKDFSKDFKIALAAMTSEDDFETLREQFMSVKD